MLTSGTPSFRLGEYKPVRNNKNDQDQSTRIVGRRRLILSRLTGFEITLVKNEPCRLLQGIDGGNEMAVPYLSRAWDKTILNPVLTPTVGS